MDIGNIIIASNIIGMIDNILYNINDVYIIKYTHARTHTI